MDRDIFEIAKSVHLVEALNESIASKQKELDKFVVDFQKDPLYALEWATGTFEDVAKHNFMLRMRHQFEKAQKSEWTIEEIQQEVLSSYKYYRAAPRSTAACSNLLEACKADVLREVLGDPHWSMPWFREAQRKDSEFETASRERAAEQKRLREVEEALILKKKMDEAAAKRKATKEARKAAKRKG